MVSMLAVEGDQCVSVLPSWAGRPGWPQQYEVSAAEARPVTCALAPWW